MRERPDIYVSNKGRFHVRHFLTELTGFYRDWRLSSIQEDRENNCDLSHWHYHKLTFLIDELEHYLAILDKA